MDTAIYKNKKNGLFYIFHHGSTGDKKASFLNINDRYDYYIPWDDLELWIEIQICNTITLNGN